MHKLNKQEAFQIFAQVITACEDNPAGLLGESTLNAMKFHRLTLGQNVDAEDVKNFIRVMCQVMKHVCPLVGEGSSYNE